MSCLGRTALVALLLSSSAGIAGAQELTTDQMIEAFQAQKRTLEEVRADPSLGPARGITLSTVQPSLEATPQAPPPAADTGLVLQPASEPPPPTVQMTLPADEQINLRIGFAFNSSTLDTAAREALRAVCTAVAGAGVRQLRIVGHTDAVGDPRYNQGLSLKRAEAVERFFVDDCRIPSGRLQAIGVGEQFPFDAADPNAGSNRRVEFQALG